MSNLLVMRSPEKIAVSLIELLVGLGELDLSAAGA
jgi:hypothetical protein